MYDLPATTLTPALIIYLIDASDSMRQPCGNTTKMALANQALRAALKDMMRRSFRDGVPQQRYHIAILAYNTTVADITGGITDMATLLQRGIPEFGASGQTDTHAAFSAAEALLLQTLEHYQRSPAPLICHLTDGKFTTEDPTPVIRRIQQLAVPDGTVLIENTYFAEPILRRPVMDWMRWPGVRRVGELENEYAQFLFDLSSPIPESYRHNINTYGYALEPGAKLFFPGTHPDLVRLAFAVSAATQLK